MGVAFDLNFRLRRGHRHRCRIGVSAGRQGRHAWNRSGTGHCAGLRGRCNDSTRGHGSRDDGSSARSGGKVGCSDDVSASERVTSVALSVDCSRNTLRNGSGSQKGNDEK